LKKEINTVEEKLTSLVIEKETTVKKRDNHCEKKRPHPPPKKKIIFGITSAVNSDFSYSTSSNAGSYLLICRIDIILYVFPPYHLRRKRNQNSLASLISA
jgi:hypothetical protein